MPTRNDIIVAARSYLDVPWVHMGRSRLGIDCAGLWIVSGRDAGCVSMDFDVPNYQMQPDGSLTAWCDRYMGGRVQRAHMKPGDGIVFKGEGHPTHLGILTPYPHGNGLAVIHVSRLAHPPRTVEHRLMFTSKVHFVAAYKFPGIED